MRKTLRIFLWMIKGVLLLIALTALVLWPVSRGHLMGVQTERYSAGPAGGDWNRYAVDCWDGRLVVNTFWQHASGGEYLDTIRERLERFGEGWRWQWPSGPYTWDDGWWQRRWGPLRWVFEEYNSSNGTRVYRQFAAPLWLVALAAGAWPALSLSLLVRRRVRRRRSRGQGLCILCGYDLRATPSPPTEGGAVLAVCPECGQKSAEAR